MLGEPVVASIPPRMCPWCSNGFPEVTLPCCDGHPNGEDVVVCRECARWWDPDGHPSDAYDTELARMLRVAGYKVGGAPLWDDGALFEPPDGACLVAKPVPASPTAAFRAILERFPPFVAIRTGAWCINADAPSDSGLILHPVQLALLGWLRMAGYDVHDEDVVGMLDPHDGLMEPRSLRERSSGWRTRIVYPIPATAILCFRAILAHYPPMIAMREERWSSSL